MVPEQTVVMDEYSVVTDIGLVCVKTIKVSTMFEGVDLGQVGLGFKPQTRSHCSYSLEA